MKLITPERIAFTASISEAELRDRMAREVMAQIGALGPDGKPLPGVEANVTRGASRVGGYVIHITGPVPARLLLPQPETGS